jgi:hypothetical protein
MSTLPELEKSEGGTESAGASPAGSMLEGASLPPKSAADPLRREDLQAFRTRPQPAANLDLLVEMNEPESLIRELKRIAGCFPHSDRRWHGVFRLCERAEEYFESINRPQPNRPQP